MTEEERRLSLLGLWKLCWILVAVFGPVRTIFFGAESLLFFRTSS